MTKERKHVMITIGVIVIAIVLWLLFRRNPALSQIIENANPFSLPAVTIPEAGDIIIPELKGYMPSNYESSSGTSCNFCIQSRVQIAPPSPAITPAVITPMNIPTKVAAKMPLQNGVFIGAKFFGYDNSGGLSETPYRWN